MKHDYDNDIEELMRICSQLDILLIEIEGRFDSRTLDKIGNQCWIARQVNDMRFGNVREQISRVEAAIKVARKTANISDLHTAITRVRHAVEIHDRFNRSSTSI